MVILLSQWVIMSPVEELVLRNEMSEHSANIKMVFPKKSSCAACLKTNLWGELVGDKKNSRAPENYPRWNLPML